MPNIETNFKFSILRQLNFQKKSENDQLLKTK